MRLGPDNRFRVFYQVNTEGRNVRILAGGRSTKDKLNRARRLYRMKIAPSLIEAVIDLKKASSPMVALIRKSATVCNAMKETLFAMLILASSGQEQRD